MPVCLSGVFFLDPCRLGEDQPTQIGRTTGTKNPSTKPLRDKTRYISDVVEVRVRQDDRRDRLRVHGKRVPVALPEILQSLEQAAIDEHTGSAVFEEVLGAGYSARSPKKGQRSHVSDNIRTDAFRTLLA